MVEQAGEEVLAAGLAVGGGVVVPGLHGGSELDGGDLLACTSHDGSLATTFQRVLTNVV